MNRLRWWRVFVIRMIITAEARAKLDAEFQDIIDESRNSSSETRRS